MRRIPCASDILQIEPDSGAIRTGLGIPIIIPVTGNREITGGIIPGKHLILRRIPCASDILQIEPVTGSIHSSPGLGHHARYRDVVSNRLGTRPGCIRCVQ